MGQPHVNTPQAVSPAGQAGTPGQNGAQAGAASNGATPYKAKGGPAYPHRAANAKKPGGIAGFFRDKKKLGITIAALVVVLVVLVVVVLALPRAGDTPIAASSTGATSGSASAPDSSYDKDANSLPEEAFIGTILPESADAGAEYVEETLFLGDSNTVRMMAYRDITYVTLDNCIGVESMGITQFATLKCARFVGMPGTYTMPEAMAIMKPRRVVITFGTNNIGMGADTFIGFYRSAIEAARQNYEYADIIIGAVPPLDQIHQGTALSMTAVDQFNVALATLAEEMDCKFLNWSEALKNPNTGFCQENFTLSDGVHITREGMEAMFTYFRTHAWISEDRRPKPLGTIPKQDGSMSDIITKDISNSKAAASSSSKATTVTVVVSAGTGGTVSGGGTYTLAFGEGLSGITAIPNDGYEFAQWSVSLGSIADPYSPTLSGFTVPGSATAGSTITITASFTQVASSSSKPESQSVSSASEVISASTPEEPVSSTPPPEPSSTPEPPASDPPVESVPEVSVP
ncbi:MAG: hypothetical protein GXY32_11150 [Ruminococcaceae bacterium]|nr:hypothetical protein [Oscillospiraceae bacterium]